MKTILFTLLAGASVLSGAANAEGMGMMGTHHVSDTMMMQDCMASGMSGKDCKERHKAMMDRCEERHKNLIKECTKQPGMTRRQCMETHKNMQCPAMMYNQKGQSDKDIRWWNNRTDY